MPAIVRLLSFNVRLPIRWQKGDGTVKRFERLGLIRRLDPVADAVEAGQPS
ncbi:hypothetical protein ABZX39_10520 [Streptomyces collinus]|uniref:hypothetical protein n=1 Tax=Streptomyces collinus TaxID=42684 RepID=UPI0033A0855B